MEPTVRLAVPTDIDSIIAVDHMAEPEGGHTAYIRRSVESAQCHVVTVDGQVVGYAVLTYSFFGNAFIDLLYIASDYRRRGYGEALMRHVESASEGAKLFTSTNLSNLRMQGLLNKLGYALSGVIHNLDEGDPELVFFKRLR
jgi:ribosomal protein S18 acetylase RimI-like enzyme